MLALLGRIWGAPVLYRGDGVEVRERAGVRTLHLDSDTVQSAMRVDQPDELELSYTRAMMAFLLFGEMPSNAVLVGLGGGSLAKFMYQHLPQTRMRVIEVSAEVIEVARRFFGTPQDDGRFRVVCAEGAGHIACSQLAADVMLVDAYDGRSLAASLATDEFFRQARRSLARSGVFVMNLWSSDRAFDHNLKRIEHAFSNRCLCLPAERPGNVIVLAFAERPARVRWVELIERAEALQTRFGLEFPRFVHALKQMNRYDSIGVDIGG